eukprot:TRINITY_DN13346_c0_g1_i2.p1 TRINITY_DN13346_c0_g1~~TRINITY_DN13346_c0_g1_i2.p1  ORF type:complete len:545 (+),score=21.08 TRINITY_DN13346_c0_g1_i2:548-2182(+)
MFMKYVLTRLFVIAAVAEPVLGEILTWGAWFSVMFFFKLFALLSRERFAHLSFAVGTSTATHVKLLALLSMLMLCDVGMVYFCITFFKDAATSVLLLLTYECVTLFLDVARTVIKYFVHLYDVSLSGTWEPRGTWIFYVEFVTDTIELVVTLGHYLHIWWVHGMYFNFVDVYLFVTLRTVLVNLRRRYAQYQSYREVMRSLDEQYLDATPEDLSNLNDACAICREVMPSAKVLPCGHMFHRSCLRSWLENQQSCPTCRQPLSSQTSESGDQNNAQTGNARPRRWEFAVRLARWLPLPNFHFEVIRGQQHHHHHAHHHANTPGNDPIAAQNLPVEHGAAYYSTEELVRRVREVVPDIPPDVAAADLAITGSVEATINRIYEGQITWERPQPEPTPGTPTGSAAVPPAQDGSQASSSPNEPICEPVRPYFASDPLERQRQLELRKRALLEKARQDFLARKARVQNEPPSPMARPLEAPRDVEASESGALASPASSTISDHPAERDEAAGAGSSDGHAPVQETVAQRRVRVAAAAQRRQASMSHEEP